jgi:hypothetical protein
VTLTRLSCHRFPADQERLWLSLIAYNLGNLWRRLALPARLHHSLIADHFEAATAENRRAFDTARNLLRAGGWMATCLRRSTKKGQVKFLREAFVLTRDRPFAVNRIAAQFS